MEKKLESLSRTIAAKGAGQAEPWGGADVVVCAVAPPPTQGGFYPDPRYVETLYVAEISWMFEQIRNIFWKHPGYGAWKEELFGRLGNVVQMQTARNVDATLEHLIAVMLHEAHAIAEEISDHGGLATMMLTWNNRILDDFVGSSDSSGMLTPSESNAFLESLVSE
jgi:hypothetical protein